jgi:transposase
MQEAGPMSKRTGYLGLDVHKATISVAVADDGPPEALRMIPNHPSSVHMLVDRVGGSEVCLVAAYEAGPTGYVLHRQLTSLGVETVVVAPSLIPVRPGDRIKTDQRDSVKLARLLRSGDLTPVWVPDAEHEGLRSLVRARADAKVDQLRARHRLTKFLLMKSPRVTRRLQLRQRGVPAAVIALDWSAQQRLHQRYQHLAARIGRPKTITAVSRELAGLVWSVGQLTLEEVAAA